MSETLKTMPTTPEQLLSYLTSLGIAYKNTPHKAVFTAEEGEECWKDISCMHCKNLFCKDAKGKFWLIVAPAKKKVDLKSLPALIGSKRLSFANEELLFEKLGVFAGSVTPFAIINDKNNEVRVVLDEEMMKEEEINFHPLTNTATTTLTPKELRLFMSAQNHLLLVAKVCVE